MMNNFFEEIKKYIENTPRGIIEKEFAELEHLYNVGPTVEEYINSLRNEYLEIDGMYFESETHEWFNDKTTLEYANRNNPFKEDGLNNTIIPFIVRNKSNGVYKRLLMDASDNSIIFESDSLEEIGVHIDKLKLLKAYD